MVAIVAAVMSLASMAGSTTPVSAHGMFHGGHGGFHGGHGGFGHGFGGFHHGFGGWGFGYNICNSWNPPYWCYYNSFGF